MRNEKIIILIQDGVLESVYSEKDLDILVIDQDDGTIYNEKYLVRLGDAQKVDSIADTVQDFTKEIKRDVEDSENKVCESELINWLEKSGEFLIKGGL